MTHKGTWGGARRGAGRKKMDLAVRAARNPRVARQLMRDGGSVSLVPRDPNALLLARLTDAGPPPDASNEELWKYDYGFSDSHLKIEWDNRGEGVVSRRAIQRPGERPSLWWRFNAPRQPIGTWSGYFVDGTLPEPRLRMGGRGTPAFEVLNYLPQYEYGLPVRWVDDWSIEYYSGRARDIHGQPIGQEFTARPFPAERFDRTDPPRFESQAAYLMRLGLLAPGEAARLTRAQLQPETLPECYWPEREEKK